MPSTSNWCATPGSARVSPAPRCRRGRCPAGMSRGRPAVADTTSRPGIHCTWPTRTMTGREGGVRHLAAAQVEQHDARVRPARPPPTVVGERAGAVGVPGPARSRPAARGRPGRGTASARRCRGGTVVHSPHPSPSSQRSVGWWTSLAGRGSARTLGSSTPLRRPVPSYGDRRPTGRGSSPGGAVAWEACGSRRCGGGRCGGRGSAGGPRRGGLAGRRAGGEQHHDAC